jgi:hypothetical protein
VVKLPPLDKQAHFWAGAAIAASVTLYVGNPIYGMMAGVFAGLAKELRDLSGHGTPDYKDFLATAAGAIIAVTPKLVM